MPKIPTIFVLAEILFNSCWIYCFNINFPFQSDNFFINRNIRCSRINGFEIANYVLHDGSNFIKNRLCWGYLHRYCIVSSEKTERYFRSDFIRKTLLKTEVCNK